MITGVILAAGSGERFGSNKLLHPVRGRPLLAHCIGNAIDSGLERIVIVADADGEIETAMCDYFPPSERVRFTKAPAGAGSHMASLQSALRCLDPWCTAVMVLLGDMPLIGASVIDHMLDAGEASADAIVVAECAGIWRHPRILPRWLFPEFHALSGEKNGMAVLHRHLNGVNTVPFEDARRFADVDTLRDLDSLHWK